MSAIIYDIPSASLQKLGLVIDSLERMQVTKKNETEKNMSVMLLKEIMRSAKEVKAD